MEIFSSKKLVPIIDAGHGGIINGVYQTAPKKMYEFEDSGLIVYEGVINRKIARKLINLLDANNINSFDISAYSEEDIPLSRRVEMINSIYLGHPNTYLLSIHSNTASAKGKGKGTKATGFEIWTSEGETRSDTLATIGYNKYKELFPNFRFRQDMSDGDPDKEAPFYILRKSNCPAFLVENLFYDNSEEAKLLIQDNFQNAIAHCLFEIVKEIQTLGI